MSTLWRTGEIVCRGIELEDEVADVDLFTLCDELLGEHLAPVDVGAVGAAVIVDVEAVVAQVDRGVTLGDVPLGQDDVVAFHAADGDLRLSEVEL